MDFTFPTMDWVDVFLAFAVFFVSSFALIILVALIKEVSSPTTTTTTYVTAPKANPSLFHRIGVILSFISAVLGADALFFSFSYTNAAKNYVVMVQEVAKEVAARGAHVQEDMGHAESDSHMAVDGGFELKLKPFFHVPFQSLSLLVSAGGHQIEYKQGYPVLYTQFVSYTRAFNYAREVGVDCFWWRDGGKVYLSGTQLGQPETFLPEMLLKKSWVLTDPWFTRASSN